MRDRRARRRNTLRDSGASSSRGSRPGRRASSPDPAARRRDDARARPAPCSPSAANRRPPPCGADKAQSRGSGRDGADTSGASFRAEKLVEALEQRKEGLGLAISEQAAQGLLLTLHLWHELVVIAPAVRGERDVVRAPVIVQPMARDEAAPLELGERAADGDLVEHADAAKLGRGQRLMVGENRDRAPLRRR